jgi:hypothetical protein
VDVCSTTKGGFIMYVYHSPEVRASVPITGHSAIFKGCKINILCVYRMLKRVIGFEAYNTHLNEQKSQAAYVQNSMPAEIWASFQEVHILIRVVGNPGTNV